MLSAFLGHTVEAVTIAVIVLFAVLLGFVQEYRADRAILALRRMAAPLARVFRDGQESEIPGRGTSFRVTSSSCGPATKFPRTFGWSKRSICRSKRRGTHGRVGADRKTDRPADRP